MARSSSPSRWRLSALRTRAGVSTMMARSTQWQESTHEGLRWQRARFAERRWALWGLAVGGLLGLIAFAPAAWLATLVLRATGDHVLLADAQGSLWQGSAIAVLAGGPDSRDARSLPGRLHWTMRPAGLGLALRFEHACCINGQATLLVKPGFGTMTTTLQGSSSSIGQWPAEWLAGIGTPLNTLQLGGTLRLSSPGLTVQTVQGRWRVDGQIALDMLDVSSRVSTVAPLGSYRLQLNNDPANAGSAVLRLTTSSGALQLSGDGVLGANGLRFRGEASAAEPDLPALTNLLNIIGRRDGARSVISIG